MNRKMLVAYASWSGSTGEVAEAVGKTLSSQGITVDVSDVNKVKDLDPYQTVIVGTAIQASRIHPDAMKFLERYQDALSKVPVTYFIVCLTMKEDTEENQCTVEAYLDTVHQKFPQIKPVDVGLFAGVMDFKKLPLPKKLIVKAMKISEGDYRNWEAIRTWVENLPPTFLPKQQ